MAPFDFTLHQFGDIPDAGDVTDGGSPEFHHYFCHKRAGAAGFRAPYIDRGSNDHNRFCGKT
jgi:hypothetical protein